MIASKTNFSLLLKEPGFVTVRELIEAANNSVSPLFEDSGKDIEEG